MFESTNVTGLICASHGHDFVGRGTWPRNADQLRKSARLLRAIRSFNDDAAVCGAAETDLAAGADPEVIA